MLPGDCNFVDCRLGGSEAIRDRSRVKGASMSDYRQKERSGWFSRKWCANIYLDFPVVGISCS